jgi:moderate conductance mechanosensitive channel
MEDYLNAAIPWLLGSGIRIGLILLGGFAIHSILRVGIRRFQSRLEISDPGGEASKRAATLGSILRTVSAIIILLVALLMVLTEMGVNPAPLIAAAGIGGLAIGFGAQNLVRDVISGFFIIVENQIRMGDVVNINGKGGVVERITLRMVRLRDLHGVVHYIPHGQITMVSNMTKDYGRYVFDIGIAYREDVDEVIGILQQIGEGLVNDPEYKDVIIEPLEIMGLDRFEDSAVMIRARITTRPIQQWRVGREFNKRMKKVFDERGIEIPFPHRTVYMGVPKDEPPPPLHVTVDEAAKSQKKVSRRKKAT